MNTANLIEKLENNTCHIHKQQATMNFSDGNLNINTCCLLFKSQLHLMIDKHCEEHADGFHG